MTITTYYIYNTTIDIISNLYKKEPKSERDLFKLDFISKELSIHMTCAIYLMGTIFQKKLFNYENVEKYAIEKYDVGDGYIPGELIEIPIEYLSIYIFEILQYVYQIYIYYKKPIKYRDNQHYQLFYHHFLTIFLISFSWYCNLFPYGIMILFFHDFSDIFLDLSKIVNVIQPSEFAGKLSLILVNLSWIICRLTFLPILIYNINTSCYLPLAQKTLIFDTIPIGNVFFYMLLILFIAQGIWYLLILKLTIKIFNIKKWKWSGVSYILNGNI